MRKILPVLTALMLSAVPASAEVQKLWFEPFDGMDDKAIVAEFDDNNVLVGAVLRDVIAEDELCYTEIDAESKNIRICFPKSQTIIKDFIVKDENTSEPEKEPEQSVDEDPKLRYPSALDAANAFMYVKSADAFVENNDIKTKLSLYYHGEEIEVVFEEDEVIEGVSSANSGLYEAPLTSLQEGDVIYCTSNLSGDIISLELIYRAEDSDIVTSAENFGTNFENLFSDNGKVTQRNPSGVAVFGAKNRLENQYAFGVIKDRTNNFMTLCNKAGQEMDITITSDTVVYVYDMSKRKSKTYIGSILDIEKSAITGLDVRGNVLNWDGDNIHNYALVRMSKGVALDVAVYLNYESK